MPVVTKETFSEMCKRPTNWLSVYIKRGKVICLGDDKIDTEDPRNKAFFEKWSERDSKDEPVKEAVKSKEEAKPSKRRRDDDDVKDIVRGPNQTYTESERLLKYYDTEKRQAEIEKLKLQIQKSRGEVIPTDVVKPIFLQHNQSIQTTVYDRSMDYARIFSKKHSLSNEEISELTGLIVDWFNEVMDKSLEVSVRLVDVAIEDYSDVKSVGEHG